MKVGILIGSLEGGGAQTMALRLMDGLDNAGVDVYLLALDQNQDSRLPGDRVRQEQLRRRIIRLSKADVRSSTISKVIMAPYQWIKLERTIRQLQIDIVISFMERANIMNLLSPIPRRKFISVRKHASMALSAKSSIKRALITHAYLHLLRRAEKINFNSWDAAEDFRSRFPLREDQISVIYNYCDGEYLRSMSREDIPVGYRSFFKGPLVITSGRLIHAKGHLHLLRAFKKISGDHLDARLIILGSGPLEHKLRLLAKDLHIEDRVLMPGFQANPFSWLARAKVFVLPSLAEGFPNALLEAMALGLPVISADCPSGPREILAPGTDPRNKTQDLELAPYGILTPPLDGKIYDAHEPLSKGELLLAEAVDLMLKDRQLCTHYSEAASQRATDFSVKNIIPQWIELIGERT